MRRHLTTAVLSLLVLGCHDAAPQREQVPPAEPRTMTSAQVARATTYQPSSGARRSGAARLIGKLAPELRIGRWTAGGARHARRSRQPPQPSAHDGKLGIFFQYGRRGSNPSVFEVTIPIHELHQGCVGIGKP